MPLSNQLIIQRLQDKFGDQVFNFDEPYGMLTFYAPKELNLQVLRFLYDDSSLGFQFLTDLCAVHFPEREGQELEVVYHLHNLVENTRIRLKATLDIQQPNIDSATAIFESANWMERETYDFYGVNFEGHPNLRRILNVDEMDYFPMRKEYPLEDQSRIDKDDEMFGRGGDTGFGNARDERIYGTVPESRQQEL